MSRHLFGLWGIDLDEEDFADALAGLGVFTRRTGNPRPVASGAHAWTLPRDLRKLPAAGELGDRWRKLGTGLRLEVAKFAPLDPVWLASTLIGNAVSGLYFRRDEPNVTGPRT
jgi:hypothetical protein